ncbi:MAG: carbamoyltransferase HypF [Propionibacteriaceae bacterium]|jgi:hydrogenase maturation factor HypF (carbamoyltransferase family)|nr:carbamoyltransferase HypF [Propionibacteriaceae bacterium]
MRRIHIDVRGIVQGVGFRPHVARMAERFGVVGFCGNDDLGVFIEAQGESDAVVGFAEAVRDEAPPLAVVDECTWAEIALADDEEFTIIPSQRADGQLTRIPPDAALCPDCLADMSDPDNRRYRYPFTTCTNCGPRLSIIKELPYDRPNTTMAVFEMCDACRAEYENPLDRRYHAQPISCWDCGPTLWLERAGEGRDSVQRRGLAKSAIQQAQTLISGGEILAVKGIGGFTLMCDARNQEAVERLRVRKHRPGKPLAVMCRLDDARRIAVLDGESIAALGGVEHPIVLVPKRTGCGPVMPTDAIGQNRFGSRHSQGPGISMEDEGSFPRGRSPEAGGFDLAPAVAPGLDEIGIMLPYAPVHELLLSPSQVLVATSANSSTLPLTYTNDDARRDLGDVADAFLMNDRDIWVPVEDSVVQAERTPIDAPNGPSAGTHPCHAGFLNVVIPRASEARSCCAKSQYAGLQEQTATLDSSSRFLNSSSRAQSRDLNASTPVGKRDPVIPRGMMDEVGSHSYFPHPLQDPETPSQTIGSVWVEGDDPGSLDGYQTPAVLASPLTPTSPQQSPTPPSPAPEPGQPATKLPDNQITAELKPPGCYPVRRSRGFAPLPVKLGDADVSVLAVGAELKNTFAITRDGQAFLSAHIGDMGSLETQRAFEKSVAQQLAAHRRVPQLVVADMHPGYSSRAWAFRQAEQWGVPVLEVQHHHAHALSLAAERRALGQPSPEIYLVLDGTGYGTDGTIWGGELLALGGKCRAAAPAGQGLADLGRGENPGGELTDISTVSSPNMSSGNPMGADGSGPLRPGDAEVSGAGTNSVGGLAELEPPEFRRLWHLPTFNLPGGDSAIKHPWKQGLALLHAYGIEPRWFVEQLASEEESEDGLGSEPPVSPVAESGISAHEIALVRSQLEKNQLVTPTSSAGRLFDAVAALLGIRYSVQYEAQAAMELEALARQCAHPEHACGGAESVEDLVAAMSSGRSLAASDPCPRSDPPNTEPANDSRSLPGSGSGFSSDRPSQQPPHPLPTPCLARMFHAGLASICVRAIRETGAHSVGLTGGCMNNRLLRRDLAEQLNAVGIQAVNHRAVPPNDGGLALGQAYAGYLWLTGG